MRSLNLKNVSVNLLRCFIVAVTLIAWGGAFAQTTAEDYFKSGNAWSDKGDFNRAIADFNQALSINPQNALAYNNRGIAWRNKGDFDKAIADFNQALKINSQFAAAFLNRGNAWQSRRDFDRAIEDYNQALTINPQSAAAYNNRGLAWRSKGDNDRAIADYTQALNINPQYAEALNNRGVASRIKGDFDRALADFNRALSINPQYTPAKENLAAVQRLAANSQTQRTSRAKEELANHSRLVAEAEAERKQRQELEERLAAESKERERLRAEVEERDRRQEQEKRLAAGAEAERKRRQELEIKLAKAEERERLAAEAEERERPLKQTAMLPVMANRKALIVGNDAYSRIPPLGNAVADANAMETALRSVGFATSKHLNVTEKIFKEALRDFKSRVEPGDEVLVFYAGHGVQVGSDSYLIPVDFQLKGEDVDIFRDETIQLQRLLDDMQEKKAKFTLLVVDACRANPLPKRSNGRSIGSGRGLVPTTPAKGQMIIYAAGKDQEALDRLNDKDPIKNGIFTRVFVREMQKQGLSVDRVLRNVRNEVIELAKSIGHEQTPAIYDESTGDFFFRR